MGERSSEDPARRLMELVSRLEARLERDEAVMEELLREVRVIKAILAANALMVGSARRLRGLRSGDLARHIVDVLTHVGPMNISRLTDMLRGIRGTASRRIVAQTLRELEKMGIVEKTRGRGKEKIYRLAKTSGREE